MDQLLIGLALIAFSIGLVLLCRPRNGKKAWFVGKPFLASLISIVVVAGLACGAFFVTAQFSSIDDGTIGGQTRKL